jgi:ubiquinone biosynthesis protein COQ9
MVDAWFDSIDVRMLAAFPPELIAAMKVRERIGALVLWRLESMRAAKEALRRSIAILSMPQNAPAAARLAWRSADRIWRLAGDTATDYNHYTKRALLIGVYGSTSLVFLDDETDDLATTRAFLDRRIGDVMRFEKAKARFLGRPERRLSLTRFLGRLRYPAAR